MSEGGREDLAAGFLADYYLSIFALTFETESVVLDSFFADYCLSIFALTFETESVTLGSF